MKALVTSSGQYGPFTAIETLADRYRCDGCDYQFSVIGAATIEDYVAPPPEPVVPVVPTSVTMRQACLALENAGILDDVEALVATLPRPYQIEWQRASMVERTNQLVEVVRQQQGMAVQQIDDMFIQAATL